MALQWSAAELVDDQAFGTNAKVWHPNLVFDAAERRIFAWLIGTFNDTADGTIFTRVRETNDAWDTTANVSGTGAALTSIDQSTALVVTPDNRYHTTWINASLTPGQKYIRYAYSDDVGATWDANHPGAGLQATHNPSLGYAAGKVRIYGHGTPDAGNHGENLYYFAGDGGSADWSAWTLLVTGTNYDSSVNARWSQYFYHKPGTWDIAYWDDNYPNNLYAGTEIAQMEIAASVGATLGSVTSSAAGTLALDGATTLTLPGIALVTSGMLPVQAQMSATLADLPAVADGALTLQATLAQALPAIGTTSTAALIIAADGTVTLGPLIGAGAGALALSGDVVALLASLALVASSAGEQIAVPADRTAALPDAARSLALPAAQRAVDV